MILTAWQEGNGSLYFYSHCLLQQLCVSATENDFGDSLVYRKMWQLYSMLLPHGKKSIIAVAIYVFSSQ